MAGKKKGKMGEDKQARPQAKKQDAKLGKRIVDLETENELLKGELRSVRKSFCAMEDELEKLQAKKKSRKKEFNVICKQNCDRYTNFRVKIKGNRLESVYFSGKAVK